VFFAPFVVPRHSFLLFSLKRRILLLLVISSFCTETAFLCAPTRVFPGSFPTPYLNFSLTRRRTGSQIPPCDLIAIPILSLNSRSHKSLSSAGPLFCYFQAPAISVGESKACLLTLHDRGQPINLLSSNLNIRVLPVSTVRPRLPVGRPFQTLEPLSRHFLDGWVCTSQPSFSKPLFLLESHPLTAFFPPGSSVA